MYINATSVNRMRLVDCTFSRSKNTAIYGTVDIWTESATTRTTKANVQNSVIRSMSKPSHGIRNRSSRKWHILLHPFRSAALQGDNFWVQARLFLQLRRMYQVGRSRHTSFDQHEKVHGGLTIADTCTEIFDNEWMNECKGSLRMWRHAEKLAQRDAQYE